jgi:hypothetical protein
VVLPGYAVLADESGVLVLSPDDVRYLAEMAIGRQNNYPASHARMRAGEVEPAKRLGIRDKIAEGATAERAAKAAKA